MCGICGYIGKEAWPEEALRVMNDTMTHRGPDDAGVYVGPAAQGYTLGMGHRRLSIQDLSPLGHQPMASADGRLLIVFNGEIYNFKELREELTGYPFRSGSDTEVILAAYLTWGRDMMSRLGGMFAFAIYDREAGELILARDRIGKKPLYYRTAPGCFAFASTLEPLMKMPGEEPRVRRDILPRYLFQQYINAPDSIFESVYKLEPGSLMIVRPTPGEPEIRTWKYWDVAQRYHESSKDPYRSYDEAKAALKDKLLTAVRQRMIADVPLGCFLSGGYDSSLVCAMAQSVSPEPVKTFSIGFADPAYDESPYAAAVAAHLGTQHRNRIIDEKGMLSLVEDLPKYYDEPFADSSQIATMLVSSLARQEVTVALSGDGGDEFACGYNNYRDVALAQKLDALGALAYGVGQLPLGGGRKLMDRYPFKVRVIAANRDKEEKVQFGAGSYVEEAYRLCGLKPEEALSVNYRWESRYDVKNWQIRRMLLDMDTYLPGDILAKVDRASMAYSLECRCPILDPEVMECFYRIPHEYKFKDGVGKYILRDIAYDYIPRELLERPKRGFGVPLDSWLRGPLRQRLLDYSQEGYLRQQGIFDPVHTSAFIREYLRQGDGGRATGRNFSKLSWSFFCFQDWHNRFVK